MALFIGSGLGMNEGNINHMKILMIMVKFCICIVFEALSGIVPTYIQKLSKSLVKVKLQELLRLVKKFSCLNHVKMRMQWIIREQYNGIVEPRPVNSKYKGVTNLLITQVVIHIKAEREKCGFKLKTRRLLVRHVMANKSWSQVNQLALKCLMTSPSWEHCWHQIGRGLSEEI